jgi:uncharacterized protein (TIGR03067 family)
MARGPRTHAAPTRGEERPRLEDFWDEPALDVMMLHSSTEVLQGAWACVEGRRPARALICGSRITVHFADGDIYMGTFSLGTDGLPGSMDVQIEEGPARHKGQVSRSIYELTGDTLRWCIASPGQSDRPLSFAEHDPLHLFLVLRRDRPNNGKH